MEIQELAAQQRTYFNTGATRTAAFRRQALEHLRAALLEHEEELNAALLVDLNKAPAESYFTETGMVLEELRFQLKHFEKWARPRRVTTPLAQFPSRGELLPEPYGCVLIMAPWNYPVQLCLIPLVGAIAAGNCAVVKPSAYAPASSAAIAKLLGEIFPPEFVAVVEGGRAENQALLEQKFDYIFFTGSPAVGREVMAAGAKNLTPVTLELGGKSPVIVDSTADIPLAARRIAFGKVLNAGQTCVAPDYLLLHRSVKDAFVREYRRALEEFFPGGDYEELPCIVNDKHFRRASCLLAEQRVLIGGETDATRRFIAPTLLDETDPAAPVMQEEIFAPILPMLCWQEREEVVRFVQSRPKPLALYLFTRDREMERAIFDQCSFGGGCLNDTIVHLACSGLPFGGVGNSGMGSYHGKQSFDTFTHYRSVLKKANWLDLPMRYHPYSGEKLRWIKRFLK
ncbi:MAG: aldehyde dehydrogenase [Clostridiales bacterium]|nr:aldehyde dehydrogenase [Clostridiales bacterium]